MNQTAKTNILQTYHLMLFDRALHPELVSLRERRVIQHGSYELEAWLTPGGHMLRFERGPTCLSELVTGEPGGLPSTGMVSSFPCAGERDFDRKFGEGAIGYMTTVQTEQLSENLYLSTLDEMRDFASDVEAISHAWSDETGHCLSLLDVQRFNREIHVQSYHMVAAGGIVLRTQTIFEHK